MKAMNYLIATSALALGLAISSQAGDAFLSPKAQAMADSLKKVPVTVGESNLVAYRPAGNARSWSLAESLRKAPGIASEVDLVSAPRPTMSPKDPNFEFEWRQNAFNQIEVAPVK